MQEAGDARIEVLQHIVNSLEKWEGVQSQVCNYIQQATVGSQ